MSDLRSRIIRFDFGVGFQKWMLYYAFVRVNIYWATVMMVIMVIMVGMSECVCIMCEQYRTPEADTEK